LIADTPVSDSKGTVEEKEMEDKKYEGVEDEIGN
jgi:hypothetical protein